MMAKPDQNPLFIPFFSGVITGAGLALFVLYVLSHAVPIAMVGRTRVAVGAVGLALWVSGGLWQRKLSTTTPGAAT